MAWSIGHTVKGGGTGQRPWRWWHLAFVPNPGFSLTCHSSPLASASSSCLTRGCPSPVSVLTRCDICLTNMSVRAPYRTGSSGLYPLRRRLFAFLKGNLQSLDQNNDSLKLPVVQVFLAMIQVVVAQATGDRVSNLLPSKGSREEKSKAGSLTVPPPSVQHHHAASL